MAAHKPLTIEFIDECMGNPFRLCFLYSFNRSNPYIFLKYLHATVEDELPSLDKLQECVNRGTTRGILDNYQHYLIVVLLGLTRYEKGLPIDVDYESKELTDCGMVQSICDTLLWQGKTFKIITEPYDMYWTEPIFHERFIRRLSEFVSAMRIIESKMFKYTLRFDCPSIPYDEKKDISQLVRIADKNKQSIVVFTSVNFVEINSKIFTTHQSHNGSTKLIDAITRFCNEADWIRLFIIRWSTHRIFKDQRLNRDHQLFEPRLLREIIEFIKYRPST